MSPLKKHAGLWGKSPKEVTVGRMARRDGEKERYNAGEDGTVSGHSFRREGGREGKTRGTFGTKRGGESGYTFKRRRSRDKYEAYSSKVGNGGGRGGGRGSSKVERGREMETASGRGKGENSKGNHHLRSSVEIFGFVGGGYGGGGIEHKNKESKGSANPWNHVRVQLGRTLTEKGEVAL